ncbi:metallophosphoesterase [Lactobacillus pentosus]|uniref:metallophosphoesterase family protein n=1 Tax=Lactiplantibacillus pentosus TaxID=1589 RepID=UPI00128E8B17|nr:metallophosphoesterase family protein [Lactiplantibacillus pentosus]MPQ20842.1 metallophosphoesterase [Lactiplantibacillus pentosus]
MVKIAVLSDVHGNSTALEAVLADARAQQVDEYWTVGDMTVRGPESERVLSLLDTVAPTAYVLGNHEENYQKVLTANPNTFTKPKQVMATVLTAFDRRQLSPEHFERCLNLPMTVTKQVGPLTIRLQHVLPTVASGHALAPTASQANFDEATTGDVDIVIYAHTHTPIMRYGTGGKLILNAGTVGLPTALNPNLRQPRASYLVLTIDASGLQQIDYRSVDFDWKQAITIAHQAHLPYVEFYEQTLRTNAYQYAPSAVAAYNTQHDMAQEARKILLENRR